MREFIVKMLDENLIGRMRVSNIDECDNSIVYRISKSKLIRSNDIDELKQSGLYVLLGLDGSGNQSMYIGKASKRSNGLGVLNRVKEHRNRSDFNWHTAILVVSKLDDLNSTELNYMEWYLHQFMTQSGVYCIKNALNPYKDGLCMDLQIKLSEFVKNAFEKFHLLDYTSHFVSTDYLLDQARFEYETDNKWFWIEDR